MSDPPVESDPLVTVNHSEGASNCPQQPCPPDPLSYVTDGGRAGGCHGLSLSFPFSFWDWEKGEKLDYFHNGNPRYTRVTAMEYLNGQDCSLLLTATGEGGRAGDPSLDAEVARTEARPRHMSVRFPFLLAKGLVVMEDHRHKGVRRPLGDRASPTSHQCQSVSQEWCLLLWDPALP